MLSATVSEEDWASVPHQEDNNGNNDFYKAYVAYPTLCIPDHFTSMNLYRKSQKCNGFIKIGEAVLYTLSRKGCFFFGKGTTQPVVDGKAEENLMKSRCKVLMHETWDDYKIAHNLFDNYLLSSWTYSVDEANPNRLKIQRWYSPTHLIKAGTVELDSGKAISSLSAQEKLLFCAHLEKETGYEMDEYNYEIWCTALLNKTMKTVQ